MFKQQFQTQFRLNLIQNNTWFRQFLSLNYWSVERYLFTCLYSYSTSVGFKNCLTDSPKQKATSDLPMCKINKKRHDAWSSGRRTGPWRPNTRQNQRDKSPQHLSGACLKLRGASREKEREDGNRWMDEGLASDSPHAQMSTGLPYASFLRTSGER